MVSVKEGEKMNTDVQQSKAIVLSEMSMEELAEVIVELIRKNPKVVSALYDVVCSCPNLAVEY